MAVQGFLDLITVGSSGMKGRGGEGRGGGCGEGKATQDRSGTELSMSLKTSSIAAEAKQDNRLFS